MIKFPSKAATLCTVPRCKMVLAFGYGKKWQTLSQFAENLKGFCLSSISGALRGLSTLNSLRDSFHPDNPEHAVHQDVIEHEDHGRRTWRELLHSPPPWDQRLGLEERAPLLPHPLALQHHPQARPLSRPHHLHRLSCAGNVPGDRLNLNWEN